MRIKYITNVRLPTDKAAGHAIMEMCSWFAKNGLELELFIPLRSNTDAKEDPFKYYNLTENFKIRKIQSFDLLGRTFKFGRVFYWVDILSFLLNTKLRIKFNDDDVLYTRDFLVPLFCRAKINCLELHSIPKSKILFRLSIKRTDFFVVLTNSIKKTLVGLGVNPEKILVVPSGVDLNEYKTPTEIPDLEIIKEGDFVFGYLGTLRTMGMEKGVADGLKALSILPDNYKFFVGGGEQDEIDYYKKMAVDLGVSNRVYFLGKVPREDRYAYSLKCDVLVAPFPENEHYRYYMSPLKIFEYMASHRPIIITNLPSVKEVLTDKVNAILINPDQPKELAEAIVMLKENPGLGKKIAEQAYEDVIKYTWENRVMNIISFIKSSDEK